MAQTAADLMMARDATGRALNEVNAAKAAWDRDPSELTNARHAKALKTFRKCVNAAYAIQRQIWAQDDAQVSA